jgi:RNA polymerase sigma factor (sigma-70 family)
MQTATAALQSTPRKMYLPMKKHAELRVLQKSASKAGDVASLVASVEGTIKQVAGHFGRGLNVDDMEDLYAAGRIGAVVAAQRYDSEDSRDCSFNTYAFFWIRAYIVKEAFFFWGKGRTRFFGTTQKVFYQYGRAERELNSRDIEVTPEGIAEILGISVSLLLDTLNGSAMDLSFDAPSKTSFPLRESLPDPTSLSFFDEACDHVEIEIVERALGKIDLREGYVLRERFFKGRSLEEIAKTLQVSKERVRQIEAEALGHLREVFVKKKS